MKRLWTTINKILAALSVIIMAVWCWKVFGPGGSGFRRHMVFVGFGLRRLFFMGVAVCCIGYLVWRGLIYYIESKYGLQDDKKDKK